MTERTMANLGLFAAVLVASGLGVAYFRVWAVQRGMVDVPNERSSHEVATPRGAGAVVLLLTVFVWVVLVSLGYWQQAPGWWGYAAGALLIGGVSFVDDRKPLALAPRLVVHALAAVVLMVSCMPFGPISMRLPILGEIALGALGWPLLIIWLVGMINAFNFIDGIDGMAGLQTVVAGLAWLMLGSWFGMSAHAGLGLILAASATGFLLHNLPKARVFLGDVGSAFLGYSLGALMVTSALHNPGSPLFAGTALFVWPVLFDTTFTLLRRWRAGRPLLQPHREHLYQRLASKPQRHAKVATLYAVLSALGVACGLLLQFRSVALDAVALGSVLSLAYLLWSLVRHDETKRQDVGVP